MAHRPFGGTRGAGRTLPVLFTARLILEPETDADLQALGASGLVLAEGWKVWTVRRHDDPTPIGRAGLTEADAAGRYDPPLAGIVEPVITLSGWARGQGYGREALEAVIGYGFGELALPELAAINEVPNHAAERMLRAVGFRMRGEHDGPDCRLRTFVFAREEFAPWAAAPGVVVAAFIAAMKAWELSIQEPSAGLSAVFDRFCTPRARPYGRASFQHPPAYDPAAEIVVSTEMGDDRAHVDTERRGGEGGDRHRYVLQRRKGRWLIDSVKRLSGHDWFPGVL